MLTSPDRSCLIRPWLALGSTGRKSLNQEISGSGMPLAAHSMVAVLVRSTTFSWGPMSILGKPNGSRSSGRMDMKGKLSECAAPCNILIEHSRKALLNKTVMLTRTSCGCLASVICIYSLFGKVQLKLMGMSCRYLMKALDKQLF